MRRQVRVFSSRDHTRALGAKDVWAVVGWSGDLIPLAERSRDVVLVAQASGTPLWADLWTVPAGARGGSGVSVRHLLVGFLLLHAGGSWQHGHVQHDWQDRQGNQMTWLLLMETGEGLRAVCPSSGQHLVEIRSCWQHSGGILHLID